MAETPTMEVRARLTAETAQFTNGMQKASQSMNEFTNQSARLRGAMVGIGVASAGALTTLIALGTKSFMAAARVDELDVAMNAVGKATGLGYQAIRDATLATKDMGIEMEIAQQSVMKFAQNNLDLAYASQLARAAQDLAVVSGKNSSETFNMLTHAVITGRSEVLKSVGIQKSAGQMYESFAKSIGKSASALTYQEKQTAVATGALAEAAKVAGVYEASMTSPGKVLRSFKRITNDIQVSLGDMLLKGIGPIIFHLYEFYKTVSKAISNSVVFRTAIEAVKQVLIKLTAPIVTFLQKMKDVVDNFTKVSTAAGEVKSNFDPVGDSVKKLAGAIEFLLPAIAAMMAMFATFAGAAIFANVPILGAVLGGLAGPIGIITVGLVTLYLTSTQVRTAVNNLIVSMKPFLDVIVKVGKALAVAGGFAVAVFAKAIGGLAIVVNSVTGFLKTHTTVAKVLTGVILALAGGFIAYKAALIVIPAIQALVAFTSQAIAVAQVLMSGGQLASIASTNGLAASMLRLNAAMSANPIGLIVAAIVGLIVAFIYAWKESETFREVVTNVFNAVAKVVGLVIGFVMRTLGYLLVAYSEVMSTNNAFGRTIAAVYEFVLDAVLTAITYLLKWYKWWIDTFVSLVKEHKSVADGISAVFEFIARVIGAAISAVLVYYANIIKGIATLLYFFGKLKEFIGEVWGKIVGAIGKATEFIGSIFSKLGGLISGVISFMRNKFGEFIGWFIDKAKMIPSFLGGGVIVSGLEALQRAVVGNKDAVEEYNSSAETMSVATKVVAGQKSINDAITGTSLKIIEASKGWGNYTDGISGTLSNVANKILDFAGNVVQYASKVSGEKILGGIITGAEKASSVLSTTIGVLDKFKTKDVYATLMDTASAGAKKAGDWLIATAATVESFTNSGFVEKVGSSIGELLEKLKTGLGFGNILAEEAKKYNEAGGVGDDNAAADALQRSADRMKSIREAMQTGIDSIKGVLDDLRNAAADFANSLKDTIVGFAGLKGVELPDGFIPKAKSLIENMNSRLNKSMQFAAQIQQLQSMNLDAGALKDIIEAGPVKGAQLAASILSGGQTAVNEISSLQKAIEYSGAAIGQMGSDAAYGGLIANAQSQYNRLTEAQLQTSSRGNVVNIAQGAFQVSIDTKGMNDEEQLKAITDKIQETFAILAKELAAK
jgi:phage-related protein